MVLVLVVVMVLVVSQILVLVSWCPGALVSRCLADCGVLQEGGATPQGSCQGTGLSRGAREADEGRPTHGRPKTAGEERKGVGEFMRWTGPPLLQPATGI